MINHSGALQTYQEKKERISYQETQPSLPPRTQDARGPVSLQNQYRAERLCGRAQEGTQGAQEQSKQGKTFGKGTQLGNGTRENGSGEGETRRNETALNVTSVQPAPIHAVTYVHTLLLVNSSNVFIAVAAVKKA